MGRDGALLPEKIQWVKPKLVCEVAFAEWTEDEQMRQTTFLSLREDKDPKEEVTLFLPPWRLSSAPKERSLSRPFRVQTRTTSARLSGLRSPMFRRTQPECCLIGTRLSI